MYHPLKLTILILLFFTHVSFATANVVYETKTDSIYFSKMPVSVKVISLFTNRNLGCQFGFGKYLTVKEIHKTKKSGKEKLIIKSKIVSVDLGYYYQSGLHHNWFISSSYIMRRTGKRGFYAEGAPALGISRTFLTKATYKVSNQGEVAIKKWAGNFYLLSGLAIGGGKTFKNTKFILNEINAKLYFQLLYPNYRFINMKPFFQLGTSSNIDRLQRTSKQILAYK
jgi:hypothetical protein